MAISACLSALCSQQRNRKTCFPAFSVPNDWVGPARENIPSESSPAPPRLHRTETKAGHRYSLVSQRLTTLSPWQKRKEELGPHIVRAPETALLVYHSRLQLSQEDKLVLFRERTELGNGTGSGNHCPENRVRLQASGEQRERGLSSPAHHIYRVKVEKSRDR